jgi:hypothetical protein
MIRKLILFLLFCPLIFSSGCETISAFREGQVNMQDVVQMTKTMPAEKPAPEKQPSESESWIHKADMWSREALW